MRIGVLVTSIGAFGQKGFYNTQEVGLAKALKGYFDEVKVYRLIDHKQKGFTEFIDDNPQISMRFLPSKRIGNNGVVDTRLLDKTLDMLVYFSDTQIVVPTIYRWAKSKGVTLIPYIGTTKSHSTNWIKQRIIDTAFARNLRVYKKCPCLVKTPSVEISLRGMGVNNIIVAPVGLDLALLKTDYSSYCINKLKQKYGYTPQDKILLFIGRLIDEKQPIRMVEIFSQIVDKDDRYHLIMVGTGELQNYVTNAINHYGVMDKVRSIECVKNSQIWELYRIADVFVNLNQQEIYGMAILEAMYYECKVVAWNAPGPSFILENGITGWLCNSNEDVIKGIKDSMNISNLARKKVLECFIWDKVACIIKEIACNNSLSDNLRL